MNSLVGALRNFRKLFNNIKMSQVGLQSCSSKGTVCFDSDNNASYQYETEDKLCLIINNSPSLPKSWVGLYPSECFRVNKIVSNDLGIFEPFDPIFRIQPRQNITDNLIILLGRVISGIIDAKIYKSRPIYETIYEKICGFSE
jgi:hypothetical protein